jgi:hypothetical protein
MNTIKTGHHHSQNGDKHEKSNIGLLFTHICIDSELKSISSLWGNWVERQWTKFFLKELCIYPKKITVNWIKPKEKTMSGMCKYTQWQVSRKAFAKCSPAFWNTGSPAGVSCRTSVLEAVVSQEYLQIKYLEEKYFLILIWHSSYLVQI